MKLLDLFESYTDDTGKRNAVITDAEYDLTVGRFAAEQGQLVASFPLEYEYLVRGIREYTTASSLNAALLSGRKLSTRFQTQYDALMELKSLHYKLNEEHHVYSGAGVFDPIDATNDDIFQTPAFISASLNIAVAAKNNNFRRQAAHADEDHLLHFILPKGYAGCFYIGPYSMTPEELEMIIFPNQQFRLVASKTRRLNNASRRIYTFRPTGA
jgi:hypothetical protein